MSVIKPVNSGAHPRVSGENDHKPAARPGLLGSSPRERGKHVVSVANGTAKGLIPA